MEGYWQQQSTWDWNLQQFQTYHQALANANDVVSAVYRRRPSRVTKPSSAGNSPHSLARRRTMMAHGATQYRNQQYPADAALLAASLQRKSRPMSWHPSSRHAGYLYHMTTSYPSWMDHSACKPLEQQQQPSTEAFSTASVYGLATPVSHPAPADSISNLYFSPLDGGYGTSMSQAFTSSEPTDMMQMNSFAWPADTLNNACLPPHLSDDWMQDPPSNDCPLPTSQIADFGHESIPSSDEFTAPPTPDMFPSQFDNMFEPQSELPTKSLPQDDELIGMGLYDEPESISLENSLLGGGNTDRETGKGLKLEETFSPAPDNDEDDEEGEEEKEHGAQEQEEENEDNAASAEETQ
ncbi:hypothetical protein VTN77DRAFT_3822 [Rasamsonia byssochlamydoides]|uniref:uncharacterized protein n=1 Tax=Rasamsonia byssochlamydoides TaxID=89139 RepID=UPI003743B3A3